MARAGVRGSDVGDDEPAWKMTRGEMIALMRAIVREERADAAPAEWLDTAQAAELLGVCTRQVLRLHRRDGLPCSWVGRLPRFNRAAVIAWMESRR